MRSGTIWKQKRLSDCVLGKNHKLPDYEILIRLLVGLGLAPTVCVGFPILGTVPEMYQAIVLKLSRGDPAWSPVSVIPLLVGADIIRPQFPEKISKNITKIT